MSKQLKIEVYMNMTCQSEPMLRENIFKALSLEGISADVTFERLSKEEAEKRGFRGSPTIIINGEEFQPVMQGGFT